MTRLRYAILVFGIGMLCVLSSSAQDKKPDEPKAKGVLPAHWKELGLTDDQKQKVYKVQTSYKTKIDKLQQQINDLKAEEKDEMLKVLSDEQKKKLKEILAGEPKDKDKDSKDKDEKDKNTKDKDTKDKKDK